MRILPICLAVPEFAPANRFMKLGLILLPFLISAFAAHAQTTRYWDNNGTTSGFGNAGGTWAAPTVNQWNTSNVGTATTGTSITTSINDPLYFGTDTINNGLGGGTIMVLGTVDAASLRFGSQTTGNVNLSGGMINLAATTTIHVGAGSTTVHTISSTITGAGTSLTKTGNILALSATNNNYAGATSITFGTLIYRNTGAKSASSTHTFPADTTLGLGVATSGSFFTSADVDNAFAGTMTGNLSNVAVTVTTRVGIDTTAGNFTYATSVSGSPTKGLAKYGANTLTLTGSNTYSGATSVLGGTLRLENTAAISASSSLSVGSGTTLQIATDTSFSGPALTLQGGTIVSDRSGAGVGLTHAFGNLLVSHATQNFTAGANVSGGTAAIQVASMTCASGSFGTATLNPTTANFINTGGYQGAVNSGISSLTLGGTSHGNSIGGVIENGTRITQNLTKSNTSTWTLSGNNTYSGTSNITGGTLVMGADNIFPDTSAVSIGTATLNASTFDDILGTLDVTGSAVINLGSGATLAFAISSAVDWTGGTLNITGTFVPGNGVDPGVGSNPGSLRFGTDNTGLSAGQLSAIGVNGSGFGTYTLDSFGFLTEGVRDVTPPTLVSISDNMGGGPVTVGTLVTYTVTFSEDMDASTVSAADFGNAGTSAITIGTITEISPGVFTVQTTPASTGTLALNVNAGAVLTDTSDNPLNTGVDIVDETIISIAPETDTDGDGIPDSQDTDDDNDGVADLSELAGGSDPLSPLSISYQLQATAGVGGSVSPASQWKVAGGSVTITATANQGYRFVGWVGDGLADPNSPTTTALMNSGRTVHAQFLKTWQLAVTRIPPLAGMVTGGGVYDDGAQATILATANQNYAFVAWQGDGVADPNAASTVVNMTADRSVQALFEVRTPNLVVTDIQIPAEGTSGELIRVLWTVVNSGNAPTAMAQWTDRIILSTDAIYGNGDDRELARIPHQGALLASASYQGDISVELPPQLPGTFRIGIMTDVDNQVVETGGENNNTLLSNTQISVGIVDFADLVVTGPTAPATASVGSSMAVGWTTTNTTQAGAATPSGGWQERVYLSSDEIVGNGDDVALATFTQDAALGVGGSRTVQKSVSIPALSAGSYRLYVFTDVGNQVYEYLFEGNNISQMVPVLINGPDLVVTAVSPPPSVTAGYSFPLSWTLRNDGQAPLTGQWQDAVWLSTDQVLSGDRYLGAFSFTGTLQPGETIIRTQTVNAPAGFEGDYHLIVKTNHDGKLPEINAGNNTGASSAMMKILPRPYPDLVPHNLVPPSAAFSGIQTEIAWSVSNLGNADTGSSSWYDHVYLSQDDQLGGDTLLGQVLRPAALDVSEGYTSTLTATIPRFLSGPHYIIVTTNGNGGLDEGGQTANNRLTSTAFPITLSPPPDLQVESVQAPAEAFSGQSATISWRVVNAGSGPSVDTRWRDAVYLSADTSLDPTDVLLRPLDHQGELAVGVGYDTSTTVTLPQGISGDFYFIVETDIAGQVFEHAFEGNNRGFDPMPTTVNLTPPPDLEVAPIAGVSMVEHAGTLAFDFRVDNLGSTITPNQSWQDAVYLSDDGVFDAGSDRLLTSYTRYGQLDVGGHYTRTASIKMPVGLWGAKTLFVVTDRFNGVFELDNANNARGLPLTIKNPADLAGQVLSLPTTLDSGSPLALGIRQRNIGESATDRADWKNEVYLSLDTSFSAGTDILLGSWDHSGAMASGASMDKILSLNVPPGVAGNYYVILRLDAQSRVIESDEANNSVVSAQTVHVSQAADLVIRDIAAPVDVTAGGTLDLTYQTHNQGESAARPVPWKERVYLSTNATLEPSQDLLLVEFERAQELAAGVSAARSAQVLIPYPLQGDYFLFVATDTGNKVLESNEGNNASFYPLTLQVSLPVVDLSPLALTSPTAAEGGQSVPLSWRVKNVGSQNLPSLANWSDTVYLSVDQQFDPGQDIPLTSSPATGPLASGADILIQVNATIPYGLQGAYHLIVVSDSNNAIAEANEANNHALSPATIELNSNPPDLVISAADVPANATSGAIILVDWTVTNAGSGATKGTGWTDSVVLSADAVIGNDDDQILAEVPFEGTLGVGGNYSRTSTAVTLPAGLADGTHYLAIITDFGQDVFEGGAAGNNTSGALPIQISRLRSDLVGEALTVPATIANDDPLHVQWTVRNSGQQPMQRNYWYDEFYLSLDAVLDEGDVKFGSVFHSGSLAPGAFYMGTSDIELPREVSGNFHIILKIDGRETVSESNRLNNRVTSPQPIAIIQAGGADIVPSMVRAVSARGVAGQRLDMEWTVTNLGDAVAGDWFDSVYLSLDASFDPALDIPLNSVAVSQTLPKDGSYTIQASMNLPRNVAGQYRLLVRTDSNDRVHEGAAESNNMLASAPFEIVIPPPGDLVVEEVEASGSFSVGGLLGFAYTVLNQSDTPIAGRWTDKFFLSMDRVWDFADTLLGAFDFNGIVGAWQQYLGSATAEIPGVLPGEYYVIVRSDILNKVAENDDFNNEGVSLGTITVTIPDLQLGVPVTKALNEGKSLYYRIPNVLAGETMIVTLLSGDPNAINELHVSFGAMPTRGKSDFSYGNANGASQEIIVPFTEAGDYYLLAYARNLTGTSESISLEAKILDFEVTGINPRIVGNGGPVTFDVRGARMEQDTTFELHTPTGAKVATSRHFEDSSRAFVTFDLTQVPPGFYQLRAANQSQSVLSPVPVEVRSGNKGEFVAFIEGPSEVRPGRTNQAKLIYGNEGLTDIGSPLVIISSSTNTPVRLGQGAFSTAPLMVFAASPDGPANVLRPKASASHAIDFRSDTRSVEIKVSYIESSDASPIDLSEFLAEMRPAGYSDVQWQSWVDQLNGKIDGRDAIAGATKGEFVTFLGERAAQMALQGRKILDARQLLVEELVIAQGYGLGEVSGQLLDATTGSPIAGAVIYARNTENPQDGRPPDAMVKSSGDGRFEFGGLPPGTYSFKVIGHLAEAPIEQSLMAGQRATGLLVELNPKFVEVTPPAQAPAQAPAPEEGPLGDPPVSILSHEKAVEAAEGAYEPNPASKYAENPDDPDGNEYGLFYVDRIPGPNGFSATLLRDSQDNLVLSFRGTEGLNPNDWYTNFASYGALQWEPSKNNVYEKVNQYLTENTNAELAVVGHSLGGGLAQWFGYDYILEAPNDLASRLKSIETFNGFGARDGIIARQKNKPVQFDPARLQGVEIYHYAWDGDIVSKLGGAHLGGDSGILPYVVGGAKNLLFAHDIKNFRNSAVFDSTLRRFDESTYWRVEKERILFRAFSETGNFDPDSSGLENLLRLLALLAQFDDVDQQTLNEIIYGMVASSYEGGEITEYVFSLIVSKGIYEILDGLEAVGITDDLSKALLFSAIVIDQSDELTAEFSASIDRVIDLRVLIGEISHKGLASTYGFIDGVGGDLEQAFEDALFETLGIIEEAYQSGVITSSAALEQYRSSVLRIWNDYRTGKVGLAEAAFNFRILNASTAIGYATEIAEIARSKGVDLGGVAGQLLQDVSEIAGQAIRDGVDGARAFADEASARREEAFDAILDAFGLFFGRIESILAMVYEPRVIFPIDPNDILGPMGFGDGNWVTTNQPLGYTIRFENDPDFATAAAQVVTITQAMDGDLDPRTFRLGSFGFSGRVFEVPTNRSFYQARIDLVEDEGFYLDVVATIDIRTGVARWSFVTIDPATGERTNDAVVGFLPVNNETPEGEGFVSYTIRADVGVPSGTVIDARATIVFDTNDPLDTPPIFNTLDAIAPQSSITQLIATDGEPRIMVKWGGGDEANGSALSHYDLWVARENGDFELWLEDTTLTEAPFAGDFGVGYAFCSIASDNAGNRQAARPSPQASVIIGGDVNLVLAPFPAFGGTVQGGGKFPAGSSVQVNAMPAAGYRFDGWQGLAAGEVNQTSTQVNMTGMRNLTARFVKVWQLASSISPANTGSVSGTGIIDDGTNPSVMAIPSDGYLFHHWEGDVTDPLSASTSVFMDRDRQLIAVFVVNIYRDYETWAQAMFLRASTNPAIAGLMADPDHDNIPNLLEYGTGRNPNQTDSSPVLEIARGSQQGALKLSYQRLRGPGAPVSRLLASTTLGNPDWNDLATPPEQVQIITVNEILERVEVTLPSDPQRPRRFFRLQMTIPPAP